MAEEKQEVNVGKLITHIQQETDNEIKFAPFGVDDENVQMHETIIDGQDNVTYPNKGSLRDFFAEWLNFKRNWNDFKTNAKHIQYGEDTPSVDSNVKVWFQTYESQDQSSNSSGD